MTKKSRRQRERRREKRRALIAKLGGKCRDCGSILGLQFAHLRPTGLNGPSRGQNERLRDVEEHPDCYTLLCRICHVKFDNARVPF